MPPRRRPGPRPDPRNVERDAMATAMRGEGKSYETIAAALGYADKKSAWRGVQRVLAATVQDVGDDLRALELERLDRMYEAALVVLKTKHYAHFQGGVVKMDGAPLEDDGPVLAAIDRLLKIQERRARLLGLDAPVKHQVQTIGALEAEVAELERDLVERERASRNAG
jgi:hypothetical protein